MFYLSGAVNVLLFLIIRPELLLFPRPEQLDQQQMELKQPNSQGDTGPATISNGANL
jgi:hypothetical protein